MRFIYCFGKITNMNKLELKIQASGMDGEGIARHNGKVYFVDGAISGEVVLAQELSCNKNFSRAKTVKIIQKSNNRCEP